jgi:alkanesulfonate monooxygenase SsuD/methylene tetrahydromethanopterin reductase-like flavin-dependent oxidoreductase (luciferase family)
VQSHMIGTVDQVIEKAQAFVDAGAREFILWFRDYPATDSLERLMTDVAPKVTA